MNILYFDHAASYPPFEEALDTFRQVSLEHFGNPSSSHYPGSDARTIYTDAKKEFCRLCNFNDGRLVLTSGGTEANNLVIHGHMHHNPEARLLIAKDTHPSIWFAALQYADRCDILPLEPDGRIDIETVKEFLEDTTTLLCMSHVCNETGIIHPVGEISELCARKGVAMLCDGVQAVGHLPVDLEKIVCDYYTFSAHKFGGPRGVGGILLRNDRLTPVSGGGNQEWGLRAGTENVAGMAAATTALRISLDNRPQETPRLQKLAVQLQDHLRQAGPEILFNSDPETGLPGLVSLSVPYLSAQAAVAELNLMGFAISAGSACHANEVKASRVILAMDRTHEEALGTLRISMGKGNSEKDVEALATTLARVIKRYHR